MNKLMLKLFVVVCALAVLVCRLSPGADWPQWRGPQRNGVSQETGLLKSWPPTGPKLLWQVKNAGSGYSTPAVVGERLYLISNAGNDNESVQARSVKDGTLVWSTRMGNVGNPDQKPPYPGSRSTPTIENDRLYALGSDGDLVCLELATGRARWQLNVRQKFDGKPGMWAYSESPLIDGDVLVCTPGGASATMVAVNKNTGDVVWKSNVPGGDDAGYASPIVVQPDGTKQYVQFLAKGVVGVDAKTGKFLWRYEKTATGSPANIPTPVADQNFVFSSTGRGGGALVKLSAASGAVEAAEQYFSAKLPTAIGGSVKVGPYLYGTNSAGLMCVEFASGTVKWENRSVGPASICYADGLLYLHGEKGEVALIGATPEAYQELGRFSPPDQPDRGRSQAWAYPVVANGRLYLRDLDCVWCYDISGGAGAK